MKLCDNGIHDAIIFAVSRLLAATFVDARQHQ